MSSWVHLDLAKLACFFAITFHPAMPATVASPTGASAIIILAITRASYKIDRKILK